MPENKGHCKHGEFDLYEGCTQCTAEARAELEGIKPSPEAELVHAVPAEAEMKLKGVNNA